MVLHSFCVRSLVLSVIWQYNQSLRFSWLWVGFQKLLNALCLSLFVNLTLLFCKYPKLCKYTASSVFMLDVQAASRRSLRLLPSPPPLTFIFWNRVLLPNRTDLSCSSMLLKKRCAYVCYTACPKAAGGETIALQVDMLLPFTEDFCLLSIMLNEQTNLEPCGKNMMAQ